MHPIAYGLDKQLERGRVLSAGIVEVVSLECGHPIGKHLEKGSRRDMGSRHLLGDAGQAVAGQRRCQDMHAAVEGQLPIEADVETAAVFLELPGIVAAIRDETKIDAIVRRQSVRRLGGR